MSFIISCPHCNTDVIIEKINCGIFRHGVVKSTGRNISPHAKKPYCDKMFAQGLIYGCGKPFQVKQNNGKITVQVCDYI